MRRQGKHHRTFVDQGHQYSLISHCLIKFRKDSLQMDAPDLSFLVVVFFSGGGGGVVVNVL